MDERWTRAPGMRRSGTTGGWVLPVLVSLLGVSPARPWEPPGTAGKEGTKFPQLLVLFHSPRSCCLVPEAKASGLKSLPYILPAHNSLLSLHQTHCKCGLRSRGLTGEFFNFYFIFYFLQGLVCLFFACAQGMQEFPGQGNEPMPQQGQC